MIQTQVVLEIRKTYIFFKKKYKKCGKNVVFFTFWKCIPRVNHYKSDLHAKSQENIFKNEGVESPWKFVSFEGKFAAVKSDISKI